MLYRLICRPWVMGTALVAVTLTVYLARLLLSGEPYLGGGDTIPTRLLPASLLLQGNFNLDEFPEFRPAVGCPYYLKQVDGHYYSSFPIGGPVLLTGAYALIAWAGGDVLNEALRARAVTVIAASLSALSALFVYLSYSRRGKGRALAVAVIYAFGTAVWPMCSQDVWQQTFGVFFVSLALLLLERGYEDSRWLGWIGLPAGWLFFIRPGNALLVAVLGLAVAWRRPRQLTLFALLSLPFLALTLAYNGTVFHHAFGGYQDEAAHLQPLTNLAQGLPGLLVSPARSLCVLAGAPPGNPGLGASCRRGASATAPGADRDGRGTTPTLWFIRGVVGRTLLRPPFPAGDHAGIRGPAVVRLAPARGAAGRAGPYWRPWHSGPSWPMGSVTSTTGVSGALDPDVDLCHGRLWDWRDCPVVCAFCGLPPHCPHPLDRGGPQMTIDGVQIELGRGWSCQEGWHALGDEAELLLDYHDEPVGEIRLLMLAIPGLDRPQVVTADLDGRQRTRLTLSATEPRELCIRVQPADLAASPGRLTLHFSAYERPSVWSFRQFAAQVGQVRLGFRQQIPSAKNSAMHATDN